MAIAGVLALVAIGLGIWGFSKKSDLNDANDQIASLQKQLAAQGAAASKQVAGATAFGKRAEAKYLVTRHKLLGTQTKESQVKKDLNTQIAQLNQAHKQVAAANTDKEKADAQLNAANQETDVAAACAKGTVAAISGFFESANPTKGANKAMKKLESLQSQCQSVITE